MRMRISFVLILSLCLADFGANAAVAQRVARGTANVKSDTQSAVTTNVSAPVSARAASRQRLVSNAGASTSSGVSGNVSARAGRKQTVVNTGAKTGTAPTAGKPMAARAGATQKVINTGTKVAAATENTAVPKNCQDAYYGCMDTFCMLDNATGGRCICSDKITELDQVLDDILKLDEQSYLMATEGVERIQMGDGEEAIMARAKEAAEKTVNQEKAKENNSKKARQLDLSIFNSSIFNDDGLDDAFDMDVFKSQTDSFADKKGRELYSGAGKMCAAAVPAECKSYSNMMQAVYAQKIKSDCMAYENSLKAQKNQSQQKLQTAQKALRDAALDEYKTQNRYATTGECAVAFAQCMQTTAECGADYTGCVTLAASENMRSSENKKIEAKQTTIKGAVSGADITLAASTLNQLLAKKDICERVVKQCVNSNKNDAVWKLFLQNAAPALKSAELSAEQDLRSNCIPKASACFKKACAAQFTDGDSYDACLANPGLYKNMCKIELTPCLEATGGSFEDPTKSTLWEALLAALNSMKVDKCTEEVKNCLTERCGSDFSGCIGLDTQSIGRLCPYQKLTACVSELDKDGKPKRTENDVYAYVAQIAQGLALQIDNDLAKACQKAAQEAMIKACGDTESCDVTVDLTPLTGMMKIVIKDKNGTDYTLDQVAILEDVKNLGLHVDVDGEIDITKIKFGKDETTDSSNSGEYKFTCSGTGNDENAKCGGKENLQLKEILQQNFNQLISTIESNRDVTYCMTGRQVQGFDGKKFGKKKGEEYTDKDNEVKTASADDARFPNLTDEYKNIIAKAMLTKLSAEKVKLVGETISKRAEADAAIAKRIYEEAELDDRNRELCASYAQIDANDWRNGCNHDRAAQVGDGDCINKCQDVLIAPVGVEFLLNKETSYDDKTNVCTITTNRYECADGEFGGGNGWSSWMCKRFCHKFNDKPTETPDATEQIQMAK